MMSVARMAQPVRTGTAREIRCRSTLVSAAMWVWMVYLSFGVHSGEDLEVAFRWDDGGLLPMVTAGRLLLMPLL